MLGKNVLIYMLILFISLKNSFANTIHKDLSDVLGTNPVLLERLKKFRISQEDSNIQNAAYYPQIDLKEDNDINYESSLIFTQNLLNDFRSAGKVDFEEVALFTAAYKYLEKSNELSFRAVQAYVMVMKMNALLQTARKKVQINEDIYKKVQIMFAAGLATELEIKKIQAALFLSRSNLSIGQDSVKDAEHLYKKVLGRSSNIYEMKKPTLDVAMPSSVEKAALYAIQNNPSILFSFYNFKNAELLHKDEKKDFYPKRDLKIKQSFNNYDALDNRFKQTKDGLSTRIMMKFNDMSEKAQTKGSLEGLRGQVVEALDLSWTSYVMLEEQLKRLREYSKYSEQTLKLYKEEYDSKRVSALDLLWAHNDVINSRSKIIKAEYDYIFAKYRILDAMGALVLVMNGTMDAFTPKESVAEIEQTGEVSFLVNFEKNSIKLPKELDVKLIDFSKYLKKNADLKAHITGHTSKTKVSSKRYNVKLSKLRAQRIEDALIKYGVQAHRLSHEGKGFSEPVADNASEEGRMKNRRVVIQILRKKDTKK